MLMFTAAILVALADPSASTDASATPSPAATASPHAVHTLKLNIPPGWQRTESGQYNEWRSPDGTSNFRVTAMPPEKDFQGPGAADAVKSLFVKMTAQYNPNATITVTPVQICKGAQTAYRVDDVLGTHSGAFMMIIPGTVSTGLINYEVPPGGKADPAIQSTIEAICWP